jgi:hypothetical protein
MTFSFLRIRSSELKDFQPAVDTCKVVLLSPWHLLYWPKARGNVRGGKTKRQFEMPLLFSSHNDAIVTMTAMEAQPHEVVERNETSSVVKTQDFEEEFQDEQEKTRSLEITEAHSSTSSIATITLHLLI